MNLSITNIERACEESQRWADEMRQSPPQYKVDFWKVGLLCLVILFIMVGLLALAAVLGVHHGS